MKIKPTTKSKDKMLYKPDGSVNKTLRRFYQHFLLRRRTMSVLLRTTVFANEGKFN